MTPSPHSLASRCEQAGGVALPVAVERFADCGPGRWWFVHHPDGFLIECGSEQRAGQIAKEITAGRRALASTEDRTP